MFNLLTKKEYFLPITILIIIGSLVHAFNLQNPLFWDDIDWIVNNVPVHRIGWDQIKFWFSHDALAGIGLSSNYYRPVLFFTFALNYVISGTNSLSYHLFSNAIHIANAILIFLLLSRLLLARWVAFLTALIFAIHPLQTEAVAYISGRGDPLALFFMLSALLLYLKSKSPADSWKLLSLGSLILALLSRETAIVFPFLLMLCEFFRSGRGRFILAIRNSFIKALPYFGIVFAYGILRLTVLNFQNTLNFYQTPTAYSENILYRLFTFMHVLVDYFSLLFVPVGLHMERSMIVHTSLFQWPVWLSALIVISILVLLRRLYVRRHPDFPVWLFGFGWFFVGLAPVSGITPINALIYEHWLYVPMIGFWFMISFYLVKLLTYLQGETLKIRGRTLVIVVMVVYVIFLGYQSIQRNILWGKPIEFYKDILLYEPNSIRINNNLGNHYYNAKDMVQAEYYYRKATEENDVYAQPYFNLGTILQAKGDVLGAITLYEQAIRINPKFFHPYQQLAGIYAQQGNLPKAAENIEALKMFLPDNPRVYYNAALLYAALNDKEKALKDIQKGLELAEADPETAMLLLELFQKISQ